MDAETLVMARLSAQAIAQELESNSRLKSSARLRRRALANLRLLQAQLAPDGGTPSSRASGGSLLTTTQHTDTSALRQRLSRLQSQLTALEEAQLAAEQAAQHQQAASTPAATPARTAGSRRAPSKTPAKQSEESLATLRSRLLGEDDETQQSALSDERQQELLTDDMLHLARNMKENAKQSQQMLQEGNETLDATNEQAEGALDNIGQALSAMQQQLEAAGGLWIWLLGFFALLVFTVMVVFIRLSGPAT